MSHLNPGLISAYNSLTDKHLAGYFSNTRIRRHLQRAGLITRSGRIVPDKEYRHKLIQRTHQRHVRECLAQAIFHKVLEMERLHQIEIKRKLEEFARRERVHKIKVERSKRYEEEIIHILSPRPPTGARGVQKQHSGPEGEHSESSESPSSSRPNTAPGKMQRPVRLKPIHSNSNTASLRRSSPYRLHGSSNENDQPFNCTMDKESRRRLTMTDTYRGISPYCLPVINNFVTPVPPTTKRKERGVKVTPSSTVRGRRLRPTTASSGVDVHEEPLMLRSSVHQSRVCVNMVYFGKTVHLSHDLSDMRDEIKVFQQHCGGENLCVYKGKLREGEMFGFISRRHRGFPFSLTFFLNGLQVERLSSCCEFKHRKGSRLGGRHGHFGFSGVEGASPCYKCIIAMGLDKKPTPPPKKVKDDGIKEETVASPKGTVEMETERTVEDASSHSECEISQPQDMETQVKEETAPEDKLRDDYEEDFEADDEGPTEDTEVKEKKSPPPPRETEKQAQQRDASETEDDEKDEDIKSHSGSSSSGSDREESDTEAPKDSRENEIVEQTTEVDQEETAAPSDEKDELNPEEAVTESAAAKDSDIQDSAGDSTEIEISDASVPSGTENKQGDETSGDKEDEKTSDKSKQGEEQERAKSVQEKLAEAILKESQCSSEPELSDTSTEEEEEATDKGHKQDNEDAVPDKNVVVEAEVVLVQEETSEPKEQKDEEAHEGNESSQDKMVKKDEDVEKVASEGDKDEATVEKDESGVMEIADAALQLVSEEKMAEGDKTSESQDDAAANTDANTDAADKDEEYKQKTAEEAETRPDETGNGAKSNGEHESSVSDLNKKTDETEVPDNAEAEAMTANETMEMKAEPSEDREALSCEEAPVTNTEGHQEDSEDRTAGSETEVTADNSSSSSEGSGDTTVHAEKAAETNEDNAKDESSKDDVKEEEAEEASGAEAAKDDSKKQVCDAGEETEKSVEINDKVEEEKSEEESKEEEKETNPDEIPESERTEERKKDETDNTEEEQNDESKAEESIKNDENIIEETKTDSNTEGKSNEEQTEKTLSEEDNVANEEKVDESEKTENDEDKCNLVDSQCVKSEDCGGESEGKAAAADQINEGEEINETNADADEEKGDGAEETEKDENDNKAKESEVVNKDEEEKEIITDMTVVAGEIISGITEEPEKSLHEGEAANANGTKTTEETLNNVTEAENVEKEAVKESENGERREVDAENGEKSTGAESKTNEDGTETLTEEKNNVNTPVQDEEDRKTDELMENENKDEEKVTVESGDGAGQREDNMVDQAPAAGMVESEAEEGEASAENLNESNKKDSEPEISGTEIKEETKSDHLNTDRKNSEPEEMKEDPNDKDSDSKKDNNQDQVSEAVVASSGDQAQSSTDHKENEESDLNSDKHTDENVAAALSAADGENGRADTEEVSKASEEGASVLLKPQEQSTEVAHNDAEESTAIGTETPEALAKEDNTDLVTNWVTMHQTSKYFETFVEPLEDLRDSEAQTTNSNTEETQSTELTRSVSPLKTVRTSDGEAADGVDNAEEEHTQKDVTEAGRKNEVEAVHLDLQNNESENNEPLDKEPGKDTLQVEETEVKNLTPNTETEPNGQDSGTEVTREDMRSEEHKGSRVSLVEDKIQEGPAEGNIEETDISKTEVESIACTNHSGISGNPESVTETQTEEKMTENQPDLHEKQTEEKKDHLSLPKTEEHPQCSESSELVSTDTKADAQKSSEETQEKTDEDSREVTEITDFTTAKSDDGSQGEIHPKPSEGSINGDRRDTQLIQDIKHTLSKDRMSMFSVDETLFGRSSYPLLTTARTESGL